MDEIINGWTDVDENNRYVDDICTALDEDMVTLKINKCRFFSDFVDYLWHIFIKERMESQSAT